MRSRRRHHRQSKQRSGAAEAAAAVKCSLSLSLILSLFPPSHLLRPHTEHALKCVALTVHALSHSLSLSCARLSVHVCASVCVRVLDGKGNHLAVKCSAIIAKPVGYTV